VAQAKAPRPAPAAEGAAAGGVPVLTPNLKGFLEALPQRTAETRPGG
jgi:hypothetical protein